MLVTMSYSLTCLIFSISPNPKECYNVEEYHIVQQILLFKKFNQLNDCSLFEHCLEIIINFTYFYFY